MPEFTVKTATSVITFDSDEFSDRRRLAAAVRQGKVARVGVHLPGRKRPERQYLNLAHVERVL